MNTFTSGINTNFSTELNENFRECTFIGEVRSHCVSIAGATAITTLQASGWAIANGTASTSQGISNPVIVTTPNLTERFLRGNATTSGVTGGADTHTHSVPRDGWGKDAAGSPDGRLLTGTYTPANTATGNNTTGSASSLPSYYEVVFIIKVK